jgi:hypothetical protein
MQAERLQSSKQAFEILLREYDDFPPGYPGGYSQFRIDYRNHLKELAKDTSLDLSSFVMRALPSSFLERLDSGAGFTSRANHGFYGVRKFRPIDEEFYDAVGDQLASRVGRPLPTAKEIDEATDSIVARLGYLQRHQSSIKESEVTDVVEYYLRTFRLNLRPNP